MFVQMLVVIYFLIKKIGPQKKEIKFILSCLENIDVDLPKHRSVWLWRGSSFWEKKTYSYV